MVPTLCARFGLGRSVEPEKGTSGVFVAGWLKIHQPIQGLCFGGGGVHHIRSNISLLFRSPILIFHLYPQKYPHILFGIRFDSPSLAFAGCPAGFRWVFRYPMVRKVSLRIYEVREQRSVCRRGILLPHPPRRPHAHPAARSLLDGGFPPAVSVDRVHRVVGARVTSLHDSWRRRWPGRAPRALTQS